MIAFGALEIFFSQIPDFDQLWWLSIVAAVMSFTYSTIGLGLGIAKVAGLVTFFYRNLLLNIISLKIWKILFWESNTLIPNFSFNQTESGKIMGSVTGVSVGSITQTQKIWRSFQSLGDMAFAYSYSIILIEIQVYIYLFLCNQKQTHFCYLLENLIQTIELINNNLVKMKKKQDTVRSPPAEYKTMKKATLISVAVTTLFYMLCGCMGYAAFGDLSPGNLLTGFGFYNPFWLVDIANAAIVIHLVGAYQVYCQPLFAFIEKKAAKRFPDSEFITKDIKISIPFSRPYNLNRFRLVWRTLFVIITTVISMILPFFNGVVGLLGALGFWPLTVYFPVEMYIVQKKLPKWSTKWLCLQILSVACLIISIAAAAGSVAGIIDDLKSFKPFTTSE